MGLNIAFARFNNHVELDFRNASPKLRGTELRLGILEAMVKEGHNVTIYSPIASGHESILENEQQNTAMSFMDMGGDDDGDDDDINYSWAQNMEYEPDSRDLSDEDVLFIECGPTNTMFGYDSSIDEYRKVYGGHTPYIWRTFDLINQFEGHVIYYQQDIALGFPFFETTREPSDRAASPSNLTIMGSRIADCENLDEEVYVADTSDERFYHHDEDCNYDEEVGNLPRRSVPKFRAHKQDDDEDRSKVPCPGCIDIGEDPFFDDKDWTMMCHVHDTGTLHEHYAKSTRFSYDEYPISWTTVPYSYSPNSDLRFEPREEDELKHDLLYIGGPRSEHRREKIEKFYDHEGFDTAIIGGWDDEEKVGDHIYYHGRIGNHADVYRLQNWGRACVQVNNRLEEVTAGLTTRIVAIIRGGAIALLDEDLATGYYVDEEWWVADKKETKEKLEYIKNLSYEERCKLNRKQMEKLNRWEDYDWSEALAYHGRDVVATPDGIVDREDFPYTETEGVRKEKAKEEVIGK